MYHQESWTLANRSSCLGLANLFLPTAGVTDPSCGSSTSPSTAAASSRDVERSTEYAAFGAELGSSDISTSMDSPGITSDACSGTSSGSARTGRMITICQVDFCSVQPSWTSFQPRIVVRMSASCRDSRPPNSKVVAHAYPPQISLAARDLSPGTVDVQPRGARPPLPFQAGESRDGPGKSE